MSRTKQREIQKQEKEKAFRTFSFRTQTRGRTGMEVNPLVFETSASTDSAIWANNDVCIYSKRPLFFVPRPGVEPGWK